MIKKIKFLLTCGLILSLFLTLSCDDDSEDGDLEISGSWTEDYGNTTISNDQFLAPLGLSNIVEYNNSNNTFYFQMSEDDLYSPNKFGRVVWTEIEDDSFYYCTIVYGKDTLAEAKADMTTADETDPASGGCGGFPWSQASKE